MLFKYEIHFKKIINVESIIEIVNSNYPFDYCANNAVLSSEPDKND